jgi:CBS domain-containing protein
MAVIRDIMKAPAIGIRSDATLAEAVQILTEHHIGGAPVVNDEHVVVGMISELALIDVVFDAAARNAPVSHYMNQEIHVVAPDESLVRAARMFALYSFRRLPVVHEGKLVGVVSRRDLMNYALRAKVTLREPLFELIPELAPAP